MKEELRELTEEVKKLRKELESRPQFISYPVYIPYYVAPIVNPINPYWNPMGIGGHITSSGGQSSGSY